MASKHGMHMDEDALVWATHTVFGGDDEDRVLVHTFSSLRNLPSNMVASTK